MASFNEYCELVINQFADDYASFYELDFKSTIESISNAKAKLAYIEIKAKSKGYPLYLIIDEYAPEDMVDKNIRTDYSKLKMLARIDHDGSHEGSRMSTIEEIAAKGEILVNLHTSFPAEKVADIDNFRSLLYYYGLLTMCGTRGDLIRMCIPNHCVREQYFGFLRDYYQKYSSIDLHYLNVMLTDLAYDGCWKPFFESVVRAYRENSSVRDGMEGERNLQGFLKAYLALVSYYLVEPELEMNYGYCDFFLLPDKQRYPDIEHSYII